MAIYKIKRFSFLSFLKSVNDKLIENERKHHTKIESKKVVSNNNQFDTLKKVEQEVSKYPTKDMENLYPAIKEFGGLPKEYYNAVQISRKINNLSSIPNWGDGDEYAFFNTLNLKEIEESIKWRTIENIPIICLGYQSSYLDVAYNPMTKKWIDLGYRGGKIIGNGSSLKGYILKEFNNELKDLRNNLKNLGQDNEEYNAWKEVEKFYEDQIKIIQQSPF